MQGSNINKNKIEYITSTDLLDAATLLDDCLVCIYPEEFDQEHIKAVANRFSENNGTISRIAKMADKLRLASNVDSSQ